MDWIRGVNPLLPTRQTSKKNYANVAIKRVSYGVNLSRGYLSKCFTTKQKGQTIITFSKTTRLVDFQKHLFIFKEISVRLTELINIFQKPKRRHPGQGF